MQESFDRVDKWYVDINQEYSEVYPKLKTPEEKKKFLAKYKKTIGEMKHEIECLNAEVVFLDSDDKKDDVRNQIRVFEMYVLELEGTLSRELYSDDNFDYKIFDKVTERKEKLSKLNMKDTKSQEVKNFKQESIDEGDRLYSEAQDRLKNIREKIKISSERLDAINEEIRAQNYKLLQIDEIIIESQNLFVRAGDLINFFTKALLKDKCMNIMVGLLFVLVIACVVLVIMEKNKSSSQTTTTATNTTNTTALIADVQQTVRFALKAACAVKAIRLPPPFGNDDILPIDSEECVNR